MHLSPLTGLGLALGLGLVLAGCSAQQSSSSSPGSRAGTGGGSGGAGTAGAGGPGGSGDARPDPPSLPDAPDVPAPRDPAPEPAGNDGAAEAAVEAPAPAAREVTFFAFGDPQYGGGPGDKNAFHIQALNAASELSWPAGLPSAGRVVGDPRGVIIAGDLTQNGQAGRNPLGEWYTGSAHTFDVNLEYGLAVARPRISAELGLFLRDYGLRGNDGRNAFVLRWRVFEGYGNHDFDVLERNAALYGGEAPASDIVAIRNEVRRTWPEVKRVADKNAGHYFWNWDDVHFVQLNLAGADSRTNEQMMVRDPRGALAFLMQDLADGVGCRPVVIVMHYGFDPFSVEDRWWDAGQRMAFLRALRPYNVIAILHGHVHETRVYRVDDEAGRSYDVVSLGSPYYEGQPTNGGRGHFAAFRITEQRIEGADVSWAPANPVPAMANNRDLWTGKRLAGVAFQTTTTFPDGWGGWAFSRSIDPRRCSPGL